MPLDGNPHPMPGNLLPNENMFVVPQYPELGWNEQQQHHHNDNFNEAQAAADDMNQQEQNMMHNSGSSGIAQSEGSVQGQGFNDHHGHADNMIINRVLTDFVIPTEHNLALAGVKFRPELPPSFLWDKAAEMIIPSVLMSTIPKSIFQSSPLHMLMAKRTWTVSFDLPASLHLQCKGLEPPSRGLILIKRRVVARTLTFESDIEAKPSLPPIFTASPVSVKNRRRKKVITASTPVRRSARQNAQTNGFKHSDASEATVKKKNRCSRKNIVETETDGQRGHTSHDEPVTPHTHISILQRVG